MSELRNNEMLALPGLIKSGTESQGGEGGGSFGCKYAREQLRLDSSQSGTEAFSGVFWSCAEAGKQSSVGTCDAGRKAAPASGQSQRRCQDLYACRVFLAFSQDPCLLKERTAASSALSCWLPEEIYQPPKQILRIPRQLRLSGSTSCSQIPPSSIVLCQEVGIAHMNSSITGIHAGVPRPPISLGSFSSEKRRHPRQGEIFISCFLCNRVLITASPAVLETDLNEF